MAKCSCFDSEPFYYRVVVLRNLRIIYASIGALKKSQDSFCLIVLFGPNSSLGDVIHHVRCGKVGARNIFGN